MSGNDTGGCRAVEIDYTNYEGKRSRRIVTPTGRMEFVENKWHKPAQWIVEAFDHAKGAIRGFALKDIHSTTPADAEAVARAEAERS